jgi:hypothetical protein
MKPKKLGKRVKWTKRFQNFGASSRAFYDAAMIFRANSVKLSATMSISPPNISKQGSFSQTVQ